MGLEELKLKIEKETEAEALKLEDEGKAEAKIILDAAKADLAKIKLGFEEETKNLLSTIEKRAGSDIQFDAKRKVLLKKKDMMEKIREESMEKISKRKGKEIQELLQKARTQMQVGNIYVAKKDKDAVPGAHEAPIKGGIIAESPDGSLRIDLSYDFFLEQAWNENMQEVARRLFE